MEILYSVIKFLLAGYAVNCVVMSILWRHYFVLRRMRQMDKLVKLYHLLYFPYAFAVLIFISAIIYTIREWRKRL